MARNRHKQGSQSKLIFKSQAIFSGIDTDEKIFAKSISSLHGRFLIFHLNCNLGETKLSQLIFSRLATEMSARSPASARSSAASAPSLASSSSACPSPSSATASPSSTRGRSDGRRTKVPRRKRNRRVCSPFSLAKRKAFCQQGGFECPLKYISLSHIWYISDIF